MSDKTTTGAILAVAAALCAMTLAGRAAAQGAAPPNLSGTYRCQPNGDPCMWAGQTPSIAQSGKTLEIKNEKGEVSNATLTSDITIRRRRAVQYSRHYPHGSFDRLVERHQVAEAVEQLRSVRD